MLRISRRVVDVRPRQLGDVDQAVDPVEVDERAEVDDVRDRALHDLAGLQAVEDPLAVLLALLLEHRAAGQHDVVARAVELDHLALDRLAHVLVEVGHAADVDQRRGQEAAHAEVDDQAALDDLDHAPSTGSPDSAAASMRRQAFSKRARFLDRIRRPSWSSLVRTSASTSSPSCDLVGGVDRLADRKLAGGDDALGLVADVDEDFVVVDPDDVAGDDITLREGVDGGVVVGDDLAVDLEQQAVGAFDDLARWARSAGGRRRLWLKT